MTVPYGMPSKKAVCTYGFLPQHDTAVTAFLPALLADTAFLFSTQLQSRSRACTRFSAICV